MTLRKKLNALVREVLAEADANADFRDRLSAALGTDAKAPGKTRGDGEQAGNPPRKRASNRRTPASVDPVQLAREGEPVLREALAKLDIEQLRDVVADYGMDPGKLVMKWRDADRIVERIVEVARGRAQKGSAFRNPAEHDHAPDATSLTRSERPDPELPIAPAVEDGSGTK